MKGEILPFLPDEKNSFNIHRFRLSPGPQSIKKSIKKDETISAEHSLFPSYSTVFIIGSDIELEFSGDMAHLEPTIQSSGCQANLQVGYGPLSHSGSHKQSKTELKTKMESTTTGLKILLQAPQIIAWVSTILPTLPPQPGREFVDGSKALGSVVSCL